LSLERQVFYHISVLNYGTLGVVSMGLLTAEHVEPALNK